MLISRCADCGARGSILVRFTRFIFALPLIILVLSVASLFFFQYGGSHLRGLKNREKSKFCDYLFWKYNLMVRVATQLLIMVIFFGY